jgi:very-short-patch-repair endonuclease
MLEPPLPSLFRLQNVSTRRRDRISSDEEERMRQGYELGTAVRFHETQTGQPAAQTAKLVLNNEVIATLTYASSATLWRINMGWRRRANHSQKGFLLDVERGYWAKQNENEDDPDDPMSSRTKRVSPYVEDTKNCLLFEPAQSLEEGQMASLQAALKSAIQVHYQLEDNELAAEPLPAADERRLILFYEAAEGGAGVLRRLLDEPQAISQVACEALKICHFDPQTGEDFHHAPGMKENCEAACYDCLMSYSNQMDHRLLDRQSIKEFLQNLVASTAHLSPLPDSRAEHLQHLRNLCQSDLEREWLALVEKGNFRLPSHAQYLLEACHTRPDFFYEQEHIAIYIDGPHHLYPERQQRDQEKTECMEDSGYTVIHFGLLSDWTDIFERYPSIFGKKS